MKHAYLAAFAAARPLSSVRTVRHVFNLAQSLGASHVL